MSTVLLPSLHSQMVFAGKVEVSVRNVYDVHGDVVALLTGQTGEADNSVLYAGSKLGTVVSAGSTLAGAGIDRLKAKRAAKAAGGIFGNAEDALPTRMQLQYFAGEGDGSVGRRLERCLKKY